jgi:hypothetical protein
MSDEIIDMQLAPRHELRDLASIDPRVIAGSDDHLDYDIHRHSPLHNS